jgi:hypothetical protein
MNSDDPITRALHQQADQIQEGPLTMSDVKGKARSIQRRRTFATVAGAAAVVAIIAPIGVIAMNNGDNNAEPPIATNTTSTTPSPTTPTETPAPGTIDLIVAGAPDGAAPQVSWLQGRTLHTYMGQTFDLGHAYQDVVGWHGGWLAINGDTDEIAGDGSITRSFAGSWRFAVGVDGTELTWFEPGKLVTGIPSGMGEGTQSVDIPSGASAEPVGYVAGGKVVFNQNDTDGKSSAWVTDFQGQPQRLDHVIKAGGTSETAGVVSVETSISDFGSCWEVRNLDAGSVVAKTCDFSLGQFSADGQYVIGWPAYGDGLGPRQVAILDATTLKPAVSYMAPASTGGWVSNAVFDGDNPQLIASVFEDNAWHLTRLGLDGSIEQVADPVPSHDETQPELWLVSRP